MTKFYLRRLTAVVVTVGGIWAVAQPLSPASASAPARAGSGNRATLKIGGHPTAIVDDQHTNKIWVVDGGKVVEINALSRSVMATVKLAPGLSGITAFSERRVVWVTNPQTGTLSEINEDTAKVTATVNAGKGITGLIPSWIINPMDGSWTSFNVDELSVWQTQGLGLPAGQEPVGIVPAPNSAPWWVISDQYIDSTSDTHQVVQSPDEMTAIAFDNRLSLDVNSIGTILVTVADPEDPSLGVLLPGDDDNGHALFRLPVKLPFAPDAIVLASDVGDAWITYGGADKVSLVNLNTMTVARTEPTGSDPSAVAVDELTGTVWIANSGDGTVTMYHYAAPKVTTGARFSVAAGKQARIVAHASGVPVPVLSLAGKLPGGLKAVFSSGRVVITGKPFRSAKHHAYRLTLTANNGVGNPVHQSLVIKVT
jgi:DNA-binding beta-propeller fold protein YncE